MSGPDPTERLMESLSVLAPHLQRMPGRDEIPADLSLGTARALLEVTLAGGELAVGELAFRLQLPLPRTSKLLGELEGRGLIERARDPRDRRRVTVRTSEAGRRSAEALRSAYRDRLRQLLAVLGTRDTEQLVRLFEQAAQRLAGGQDRSQLARRSARR